jgi:hypothetical protein
VAHAAGDAEGGRRKGISRGELELDELYYGGTVRGIEGHYCWGEERINR